MEQLLIELKNRGIGLWLDGDSLRVNAPKGTMNDDLRAQISRHKAVLVDLLRGRTEVQELPAIAPDPRARYEPFPLTDVQHAYWMGRRGLVELGNVSTHFYFELDCERIDVRRLSDALQRVIGRHEMLRAVVDEGGMQRILPRVPPFVIPLQDCSLLSAAEAEQKILEIRGRMSHQVLPSDRWPLFEVRATVLPEGRTRLHVSLDMLVLDAWSMFILFREWFQLYDSPDAELPAIDVSYRDYILAERQIVGRASHRRATQYWMSRIDTLPAAPELPVRAVAPDETPRFSRRRGRIDGARWSRLKELVRTKGLTVSGLLLAAYAEVIARWSSTPHFTLNLTLFNRLPLHPHVDRLLGDFTSLVLLEVDHRDGSATFLERARRLQRQLMDDLGHREVSGVEVLREWMHRRDARMRAAMPVVFTSALVLRGDGGEDAGLVERFGPMVYGVSQTPQVWLDNQAMEVGGELVFNWDAVDAVFEDGVLDAMFGAYCELLRELADVPSAWHAAGVVELPEAMRALRAATNATRTPEVEGLLHTGFVAHAAARPDAPAVIASDRTITYGALLAESAALARRLRAAGAAPGKLVAILMRKGWEQVVGVMGTLLAGAAYMPLDARLPRKRRMELLAIGEARHVVTQPNILDDADRAALEGTSAVLEVVPAEPAAAALEIPEARQVPDDLAYVIFTSGTTGVPKGVMIQHRGAVNTVAHVNRMHGVSPADRVLAVSSLGFDLSVYDIFGPLSAGGTVVIPDPDRHLDPVHWKELVERQGVTLWNSAPQLMRMLLDTFAAGEVGSDRLRAALLSGDWIPLDVPGRLATHYPNARTTSLGGATEASVWSNSYRIEQVDPAWPSIPYGKPLPNQTMWVLDHRMRPCPDHVTGKIYIGGVGLAHGYWRDAEKTAQSFVRHPVTGERLYETGDLGRYLADGNIQFLGRGDEQVKIRGHRVEPGEVASVLRQHPEVEEAAVLVTGTSRDRRELVAYVELDARRVDQLGVLLAPPEEARAVCAAPLASTLGDELVARAGGDGHAAVLARVVSKLVDARNGGLEVLGVGDEIVATAEHVLPALKRAGCRFLATATAQQALERARADLAPHGDAVDVRLLDLEVRPDFQGYERHRHDLVLAAGRLCSRGDPGRALEHARELLRPGGRLVVLEPTRATGSADVRAGLASGLDGDGERDGDAVLSEDAWQQALRRAGFVDAACCRPAQVTPDAPGPRIFVAAAPLSVALLDARAVARYLADRLPEYMVPKYVVQVGRVPVSSNGKIDYRALPPVPEDAAIGLSERVEPRTEEERLIRDVWARVMNRDDIGVTDNFFDLGGDSLTATRLVREINAILPFALDLAEVVENPTIEGLANVYAAHVREQGAAGDGASAGGRREVARAFPALLVDERRILTDVLEGTKRIEALEQRWLDGAAANDAVLVTGATGWIGAYVVAEILATSEADVFCLVRAEGEGEARARMIDVLRAYRLLPDAAALERIKVVPGRLERPRMGLDERSWRALSCAVSGVYHFAASVSTVGDYEELSALNVRPVEEIVRFALEGRRKAIFYGSSAAVNLRHGADGFFVIPEEGMTSSPAGLLNGYAQTKWTAEQLVAAASHRGVPAKIFRISHALPAEDGFVRRRVYMVEAVLAAARRVGAVPDWPESRVYGVPVDKLARILVACARAGGRADGGTEVIHVDNRTPMDMAATVRILHAADGVRDAPIVPREEWRGMCFSAASSLPAEHAALATRLFEPTVAGALVEIMFGKEGVESAYLDRLPGGPEMIVGLTQPDYWERYARAVRFAGEAVPQAGAPS
jgi:amino acid adenylation domain-containing protein/thioester reductase-like protein